MRHPFHTTGLIIADLGSMMQNPMFQNMAKNLMSNPEALQGLMNNPQLRGLAERFGAGGGAGGGAAGSGGAGGQGGGQGGGGGMPDLASLMNDPSIAEMSVVSSNMTFNY